MLRRINRFIAWLIILVVVVSIFLAVAAIAGSWVINSQVTNEIMYVLDGVQTGISVVSNSLERLDTSLGDARDLLETVNAAADRLGERIEESSPVVNLLTKTVNEDLVLKINTARETAIAIRDGVVAFNSSLLAINALPFVEVPTLTDQLQTVSEQLADLALGVQELRGMVAQVKAGVADTLVTPITQTTTNLDMQLEKIQSVLQGFMQQVSSVQDAVTILQTKLPFWIDMLTLAFSLFFLWIILAQLAVLAIARGYLRTGYLPWNYPLPPPERAPEQQGESGEAALPATDAEMDESKDEFPKDRIEEQAEQEASDEPSSEQGS